MSTSTRPSIASSTATSSTIASNAIGAPCEHPFVTTGEHAGGQPTPAQTAAAATLIRETRAATRRFADESVARRAGYAPVDSLHWDNPAYRADGAVLDPTRPEELMYTDGRLVGAMYTTDDRPGPQIGGPLTVWHTHCQQRMPCALPDGRLVPSEMPGCRAADQVHLWMLHVWLVPNPLGQFAFEMQSPPASSG